MIDLAAVARALTGARRRSIGYPGATDISFTDALPFHAALVNNVGDPDGEGRWRVHTKAVEREVLVVFAAMFGATPTSWWGYVTGGGSSEGVLHGLWLGIERHPSGRLYHSSAAHYSASKAARLLRVPTSTIPADPGGEMRYDRLTAAVHAHRDRAALVLATAGTTMTEAVDDITAIHAALNDAGAVDRFVVVDAALSGPALALDGGPTARLLNPDNDRAGADYVCFSSHKSFATPHVSGVALTHRHHITHLARVVDYLGGTDTTISGSRSGQAPLELAHVLTTIGLDGLRHRAHAARSVADHAVTGLRAAGWPAWRHHHAWTVVLPSPPEELAIRWSIPTTRDGLAHIVCAPGVTTALIDEFLHDLAPLPPPAPPAPAAATKEAPTP